jgi:hypothetical protein
MKAEFEENGFSIKVIAETDEDALLLEDFNKAGSELGVVPICAGFSSGRGHVLLEIDSSKKKADALIREWRSR